MIRVPPEVVEKLFLTDALDSVSEVQSEATRSFLEDSHRFTYQAYLRVMKENGMVFAYDAPTSA